MERDGVLLLNKPKGLTSARVVEKIKRKLRAKKVGHTGTLDPIATGVLILLIGKATRFSWLFTDMDKTYLVKAVMGIRTDTYDIEGEVLEEKPVRVSCEEVHKKLASFEGDVLQSPPPFSAKRVKGKRAYKLARKGIEPELKPVKVRVFNIELVSCELPEFEVRMRVSSGTYVRSLIHELGKELSCGAVVRELVRESVGPFSVDKTHTLDMILSSEDPWSFVLPIEEAFTFLPKVSVDYFNGKKVLNGNAVLLKEVVPEGYVTIYIDDTFIGVGKVSSGVLKPERLLLPEGIQT